MEIITGDALEELRKMPDNSVDSVVTDPPAGISFMGKSWDSDRGGSTQWIEWLTEVMRETLRVLKPGGHAFVWAIPRTSHWTGTAIERAGFQIRDVVTHLFGQGFPKSLDISKAIDKAAGAERDVIGRGKAGKSSIGQETRVIQGARPTVRDGSDFNVTAPSTPDAKLWDGWGTALKPAAEFWILARKPLSEKTVAGNVLKWGTGGLNIDGCRIGVDTRFNPPTHKAATAATAAMGDFSNCKGEGTLATGRFPANVILDPQAGELLDGQTGDLGKSAGGEPLSGEVNRHGKYGSRIRARTGVGVGLGDSGGASRFYYCAKASVSERNAGVDGRNTHPTVKPIKLLTYLIKLITPPGGIVLDTFMGSGSVGCAALTGGFDFIGIDSDPVSVEIARQRLAAVPSQLELE